jgi:hypothetical protein
VLQAITKNASPPRTDGSPPGAHRQPGGPGRRRPLGAPVPAPLREGGKPVQPKVAAAAVHAQRLGHGGGDGAAGVPVLPRVCGRRRSPDHVLAH